MKLSNVTTKNGKFVYQRRVPTDLLSLYPIALFQTRFVTQEKCPEFVSEHAALEAAFTSMTKDARSGHPEAIGKAGMARYIAKARERLGDTRTERERWEDLKEEAEVLVRSVRGVTGADTFGDGGDDARREIVADELERTGADPLLYRAVVEPDASAPPVTLADAAKVYSEEKLGAKPGKSAKNTFNKIKRRLEASLGPLDTLPLIELRREHAKKVRDDLSKSPKKGGGTLSAASVQREIISIKSLINVGIREHDLKGKAFNPFEGLSIPNSRNGSPHADWQERDPLPDDVLVAARKRIMNYCRVPELRFIWRLLQATGCRGAEITGLRIEDVVLNHKTPHIWVRWHDDRRVKSKTSIRPVPLVGDGLVAARKALEHATKADPEETFLFARYAHEGGPDAASGALMGHLRKITDDPRHVVYSLRHNIKSWLGTSNSPEREENRLLGHADASVGNRYYGGLDDRLAGTSRALEAALKVAPKEAWSSKP